MSLDSMCRIRRGYKAGVSLAGKALKFMISDWQKKKFGISST
jgi:hypothetical protein